jgi:hypothetical protein
MSRVPGEGRQVNGFTFPIGPGDLDGRWRADFVANLRDNKVPLAVIALMIIEGFGAYGFGIRWRRGGGFVLLLWSWGLVMSVVLL